MRRRAFTLIEMLVSLAITLIMMGAVVSLFGLITDSVSGSRSVIEMSERLRACRNRLQTDLQSATATMQPPLRPESDEGYFEYIEGPFRDLDWAVPNPPIPPPPPPTIIGDNDDVLMFTVRSRGESFVGKLNIGGTVESQTAEVMYFAIPNGPIIDTTTSPPTRLYTLYRRVLLVAPQQRGNLTLSSSYYDGTDISVHVESPSGSPILVPNTLGDLTKRENRFAHNPTPPQGSPLFGFPFDLNQTPLAGNPNNANAFLVPLSGVRLGDDVILTNVLAFDVQIFDPTAQVRTATAGSTTVAVTPTDPGYASAPASTVAGAYVDLGTQYPAAGALVAQFNNSAQLPVPIAGIGTSLLKNFASSKNLPTAQWIKTNAAMGITVTDNPLPNAPLVILPFTYDTWSLHYENDGIDQNQDGFTDAGTNGLDDAIPGDPAGGNGVVDDPGDGTTTNPGEYDTHPPYLSPMRGIRVIIRVYEPSSQQVRQVTVVQDFLPE